MRNVSLICVFLCTWCIAATAQNITRIEYFIDTDPGFGLGTAVTITPAQNINNLTFNIPVNSLSSGFHMLYVRAKNASNNWGQTNNTILFKTGSVPNEPVPNITRLEYFIDTDPGFGLGISVPITSGATLTNQVFNIPVNSLTQGFHTLYLRARNANGNWSTTHISAFFKVPSTVNEPLPNVTRLEYFIDTDPGFGLGTSVPITSGATLTNQVFSIPVNSLTQGFHTLYLRARNANGNWSTTHISAFFKVPSTVNEPLPNVTRLEYFIDTDPGYGNGTAMSFTPGTSISNLALSINVGSLTETAHKLYIRGRDQRGGWSTVHIFDFNVCNATPPVAATATAVTSTSFTTNWGFVSGATSYLLDVSTDNFTTYLSGFQAKSLITNSSAVTGLTQATTYQYRVRAVVNCTTIYSNVISVTTPVTTPGSQPSNLQFANPTQNGFTVSYTAASGPPTGYLVVRKATSSPTFVPINDTNYTLGQTVGDGVIAYKGSGTIFLETTLAPGTQWYYDLFSYNQVGGLISYRASSPLEGNFYTVATEPTAQPTAMLFTNVTDVSLTVSFTAAVGSPTGYLVLRKISSAATSLPVDGTAYTTTVGTDAVAYVGPSTTFAQTSLTQNTDYYYTVFAYNGSGTGINYLTLSPLQNNQLTPITPPSASPTNLLFSNVTPTSMTVSFTAPAGNPSGYLVVRKTGSNPVFTPQINASYVLGQTLSDGVVAYVGSNLTFNESNLTASTIYFYDVFAYNQIGGLIGYRTVSPLEGSKTTFTAEPTAQPTALVFPSVTTTSINISFAAATPAAAGYLVLRNAGSAPTTLPVDGQAYTGDGTVVSNSAATSFVDSGLLPGTTYFYQVFSYNGSGATTNYLVTVSTSNSGSTFTLPDKPILLATTAVAQNQFTVNWSPVVSATNYKLDVSKDNFASFVSGFSDVSVSGVFTVVTGLETGIAYKYRLRAVNASGVSVNSDEGQQFTIPATPVLALAASITQISFTASWSAVFGAIGYVIDVSLDNNFATFVAGYQNKLLSNVSSEIVTGLTPGLNYYYRLRSTNTGGTSPSSTIGSQLLIPATPIGLDATNTTTSSFKAKWQAATGATEYRVDVSLASANFNPSLTNYTNVSVVGNIELLVTGLLPSTGYLYRIRALNATPGTSPDSPSISVATLDPNSGGTLSLIAGTITSVFNGASVTASAEVSGGSLPYVMVFYSRKMTAASYTEKTLTATAGTTYQSVIDAAMLDDLGVDFYFKVTDGNGQTRQTAKQYIHQSIPSAGLKIPFTKSGGTAQSYELFSIPYVVTDNLIGSIFNELVPYDKTKWRLVRYEGGKNVDFEGGINRIELGKGYWFNRKANVDISFAGGTVGNFSQATSATLQLEKGWNQIGDPFTFNVDWSDILAANPTSAAKVDATFFGFDDATSNFKETDVLKAWGGGFAFANEATQLSLPVTLKNTFSGGRKAGGKVMESNLDAPEWLLPISLRHGAGEQTHGGVGMHLKASASKDQFDKHTLPRFINYVEWSTYHEDFFSPAFARDVVPTSNSNTWLFTAESNFESSGAELTWDHFSLGQNEAQLFLLDQETRALIDMKKTGQYTFDLKGSRAFKIYFASNKESFQPDISLAASPYPNPFDQSTTIPFVVNERQSIQIEIYDITGRKVKQVVNAIYEPGIYQAIWDGADEQGNRVAQGLFTYRFTSGTHSLQAGKLVVK